MSLYRARISRVWNFESSMARYRVTVDTGGTFSDFVYLDEETGEISIAKVPSTPDDPSRAILAGIEDAARARRTGAGDIGYFCHGTTVGTNALLEGKGAAHRAAGDRGISRHLSGRRAGAAVRPRDFRRHVRQAGDAGAARASPARSSERVDFRGEVLRAARRGGAARHCASSGARTSSRSRCACCSRSCIPSTRRACARSCSRRCRAAASRCRREVLPQIREYYRLSTTVINAYLQPILARYIAQLDQPARRRRHRDAAEIHHAVERRHGDLRRRRAQGRDHRAVGAGRRRHRGRARLPHDRHRQHHHLRHGRHLLRRRADQGRRAAAVAAAARSRAATSPCR